MGEQKQQLVSLRDEVNQAIQQLALDESGDPQSNLQVLMAIVNSGSASLDVYRKALELVRNMPNDEQSEQKMDFLLDLLYNINEQIDNLDEQPNTTPEQSE